MEKFTPSELCADIKIYNYKKKVKYDEKSLVIFEKTGKMITAGKECEGMLYAEKMLKQMLCRYLGKSSFTGYGEGLIFIHEKLNEVEMKAYFDLLYQAGAKNVVYADESVKGIPEGTPWEDVIWGMKNTYKNLRFAVEITKEQPMDYLRYSLAQLAENCKRWGLEEEMSKLYI